MVRKYDHLKGNPEPCVLSFFYMLCCGILLIPPFRRHNFPSFPVRILPGDAAQAFGRRSRPDYAAPDTSYHYYISMVLNVAVLCSAMFAFSNLPLLCRWGSRSGRCNSGCFRCQIPLSGPIWWPDQPSQPSDHLFHKNNPPSSQPVSGKTK